MDNPDICLDEYTYDRECINQLKKSISPITIKKIDNLCK